MNDLIKIYAALPVVAGGAPLVFAGALFIMSLAALATLRRSLTAQVVPSSVGIASDLLLAGAACLLKERKGPAQMATLLTGRAADANDK
jgi:hypothetical protein